METKIVIYKDGSYKIVKDGMTWEYENDKDWFSTIKLEHILLELDEKCRFCKNSPCDKSIIGCLHEEISSDSPVYNAHTGSLKKLYITEDVGSNPTKWILNYEKPEFQGGPGIEIDEETACEILKAQKDFND